MYVLYLALAAFMATFLGGIFALRFKDKLHLILGFSAGAVIGVAFFDLIPEALSLLSGSFTNRQVLVVIASGFLLYMLLDRAIILHGEVGHTCGNEHHKKRGWLGAGSLALHSFIDGLALGLAFQVSPLIGFIVAVAVLTHDFSDGINTVNMIVKGGGDKKQAFRWLVTDAVAPVCGVIVSLFISVDRTIFGTLLALFAGFFLYIGASDLLPESHHNHPTYWTTFATILGVLLLYAVTTLVS